MRCKNCESKMDVLQVYDAGDTAQTRSLQCRECGYRASSVTFLVERPQRARPRGFGAWALKKRIESGDLRSPLIDEE